MTKWAYRVGDKVAKCKGYKFLGTVVAEFDKLDGEQRYVVEHVDGILHIFNGDQLYRVRDEDDDLNPGIKYAIERIKYKQEQIALNEKQVHKSNIELALLYDLQIEMQGMLK